MPFSGRGLTGSVPPQLGDLDRLGELNLSFNRLTGGIPGELGGLTGLTTLWLFENQLRGGIPHELGGLSNLVWLSLSNNMLNGPIPASLAGLTNLSHMLLYGNQLSGEIPPELGVLTTMTVLQLERNELSGAIPWELGGLSGLVVLRISDNPLEGCVPPALREVTNDFDALGLPYCAQDGPVPVPEGVSVSVSGDTFTITWGAVTGAARYEVQGLTDREWASTGATTATALTYSPEGGPACETTYEFRVRAYGDGATYVPGWGSESESESVTTGACSRDPMFDLPSYAFAVREDASPGYTVGAVSATDPDDGDILTYSIIGGNEDARFSIDDETGAITVAGALNYEATPSYSMTVGAGDGRGGSATAEVEIAVTDVPEDHPPAPENLDASLEDVTFSLSWSPVSGAVRYEAQHRISGADDDWTALPATNETDAEFTPDGGPACGSIYEFRVRAYGDGATYLADWGEPSGARSVATDACNRDPAFGAATYDFPVREDASAGDRVGDVSATDPDDGDVVEYSIAAGNEAGKFDVGTNTGVITVSDALDYGMESYYALTIAASDGRGGDGYHYGRHIGDRGVVLERHRRAQPRRQSRVGWGLHGAAVDKRHPGGRSDSGLEPVHGDNGLGRRDGRRLAGACNEAGGLESRTNRQHPVRDRTVGRTGGAVAQRQHADRHDTLGAWKPVGSAVAVAYQQPSYRYDTVRLGRSDQSAATDSVPQQSDGRDTV